MARSVQKIYENFVLFTFFGNVYNIANILLRAIEVSDFDGDLKKVYQSSDLKLYKGKKN